MDLIRKRSIVPDPWRLELAPTASLDTASIAPGDIIVSVERWLGEPTTLRARGTRVGVRLGADDGIDALVSSELHELALVDFHFASFAEGRAYSQARLLRARHGFRGTLRASGDVSRDRLSFMERCGFDEFRPDGIDDLAPLLAAFDEVTLRYQPDVADDRTVARRRGFRRRARVSITA